MCEMSLCLQHNDWQILRKQRYELEELDKSQPNSTSTYLLSAVQRLSQYLFWSTLRENWGWREDTRLPGEARYIGFDLVACRAPLERANTQGSSAKLFPLFSGNQQEEKELLRLGPTALRICLCTVTLSSQVSSCESFLILKLHTEASTQITFQASAWPASIFQEVLSTVLFFLVIVQLHQQARQCSLSPTIQFFLS